ncbi:MAG: hypothetical protein ACI35S_01165 [Anaeroplasma sp.]
MSKNNKNSKKNTKDDKKKNKAYKNPATTLWGKIIILILALAMCLSGLISLIYLIIQNI